MYVNFKPKTRIVSLYNDNGSIVRKFITRAEVIDAHISGSGKEALIAIVCKNGVTEVYKANGTVVRRSK